jgi:gliding motility-associated-like protein
MNKTRARLILLAVFQLTALQAFAVTASFTFTKVTACAPTVVIFTNNSTRGTGIIYSWDFGLGATVNTTDPSPREQLYTKPGLYIVRLKVTNGVAVDSMSMTLNISKGPVAVISADPASGCVPLPVTFTSSSVQGDAAITSTDWDFRNGDHLNGVIVSYTYNTAGQNSVLLKVTDANGCYSHTEAENIIRAVDKPKVLFAASDTFGCSPPLNVSFTNMSTGASSLKYNWNYGNGDTSTEISNSEVYSAEGTYSVKLKATDIYGCSDSLVKKDYIRVGYTKGTLSVYDANNKLFNHSFICDGVFNFVYSDPDLPSYKWTVTDNNSTKSFSGSSSLSYRITGTGSITVKLVFGESSFCTDSITLSFVKSYIKASFTLADTMFCSVPQTLNLINASQNADKVAWYLSDSLLSTDKVTTHILAESDLPDLTYEQVYSHGLKARTLPLKLVASNGGVCFDSLTRNISVIKPVVRFMPDRVSGCVPLKITLSDSSRSAFKIDSYTYRIGSGRVSSANSSPVSYTITEPGEYDVSEILASGNCSDTSRTVRIVAGQKLSPDFTVTPAEVCNGGSITLSGSSGNNSAVRMWRYSSPGLFDISLRSGGDTAITVYTDTVGQRNINLRLDYNGCISDTLKKNAVNIKGPAGTFTGAVNCDSSLTYRFRSFVRSSPVNVWKLDTVTLNGTDSFTYRFRTRGDYPVRLSSTDPSTGCSLERTKIFRVRQLLSAFLINDTVFCAGDSVKLDSSPSKDYINSCYNEGFLWYFGDGSPPRRTFQTKYDHIYTARGYDTIALVVTGDNGCTDTTKKVVYVARPSGSFTSDRTAGCVPSMNVKFANTSTDTTIIRWIWNFGDNTADSTNKLNVTHLYTSSSEAVYYPNLTVYDKWSCSSAYSIPTHLVSVNRDFQAKDNSICLGESISVSAADTSLKTVRWNYGDGTASTAATTHTYLKAGRFTLSMIASKEGCQDSSARENYIYVEKAGAAFSASDTVRNCYPATINFVHNDTTGSPPVEYLWVFDSHALTDHSSGNVNYTFTRPGKLMTWLTVRTLNGCAATSSKNITVLGPDALMIFSPKTICYGENVAFRLDSMKNVSSWKWFFGDGITSTANPVTHRYTSRGSIVPSVQLVSPTCTAVRTLDTLSISKVQALFKSSDSNYTYCDGRVVDLVNSSVYSNSWTWFVDNVQVSYRLNLNGVIFDGPGQHLVTLVARKVSGCSDTLTKTFLIKPAPAVTIDGDTIMCAGKRTLPLSVEKNAGDVIDWTPASSLDNSKAFTVMVHPSVTTVYKATVTNNNGCSGYAEKTVHVNESFAVDRIPAGDTVIYLGEGVQLTVNSSVPGLTYTWSPARNISCTACNNPWVYPTENTAYTVTVSNGCFNSVDTFNIELLKDFYLAAPTAFTPNGDSNNDLFRFESKNIESFDLKIFNRWGEIVFKTTDINQGWDGYVNGKPQNMDTYKYTVKARTVHGYEFTKGGEFLLLR